MIGYLEGLTKLQDAFCPALVGVEIGSDLRGVFFRYKGKERVIPLGGAPFYSQYWADAEAARFAREVDFPVRQAEARRRFRTEQRNILARQRRRR